MTNTEIASGMFDNFPQLNEVWITADGQVFTHKPFAEAHSQAAFNGAEPDHVLRVDIEAETEVKGKGKGNKK